MNSAANTNATPARTEHKVEGSKYLATKDLGLAELAQLIREDIKALAIPGLKVSVRISRYSMGRSIDIRVTAAPFVARFEDVLHDVNVVEAIVTSRRQQGIPMPWLTDEARAVQEALEAIHGSYNFDNSDFQTDYFHTRFAGSVSFSIREAA